MTINATQMVRELAVDIPGATRIFEKLGIDYCCGGGKNLKDACLAVGVSANEVTALLKEAASAATHEVSNTDWSQQPLSKLTAYIVRRHHAFTRDGLDRLRQLLLKVCPVHSVNHPELLRLREIFQRLEHELRDHLFKEEQILFPYIEELENAVNRSEAVSAPFFGTVRNPVHIMEQEHDDAGAALKALREVSSNYQVPSDGCISFQTLYEALENFERDLHEHIHLENNILFPRAAAMEARA